jgi:EmrB/QacA subfamily drug resistance transporter
VQWVVLGYVLAISALLLPMGRLGDIAGRKQVYVTGLIIFTLAAAWAGFSINLPMLITAKIFQGVGSAMIQGTGMAIVVLAFPGSERGKALGSHLSVVGIGAIAGMAIGGLLVSALGWRSIFFANFTVGLFAIVASMLLLSGSWLEQESQGGRRLSFDWLGAALSGGALLAFLLVVGNGDRIDWALAPIVTGIIACAIFLITFICWELHTSSPMLELRLFTRRVFAVGVASSWISFMGGAALRFMTPFYLQRVLGYSPAQVGALMIPAALFLIVLGPLSGHLSDKFGWRRFATGGLAVTAIAFFILATSLTERSSVVLIISMLVLHGWGMGIFGSPNRSSIFSAVEQYRYGVVSALTQLVRNAALVTSIAVATTVVVVTMGSMGVEPSLDTVSPEVAGAFVAGLRRVFMFLGALQVIGMAITFLAGIGGQESLTPNNGLQAGKEGLSG